MATAQTLINRSLRMLGQISSGEDPTADETADCLIALNAMLDSWRNEKLMCYALREESLTLAAAATSTIGPTGTLATTRPLDIEAAWIVSSNVSYPVRLITDDEYAAISDKTTTGDWPTVANYRPTMSNGTLYVYPVPSTATQVMKILTRTPLTAFSAATDTVTLPPGWEEALAAGLAVSVAPEFEAQVPPAVMKMAVDAKANIKRTNSRPIKADSGLVGLFGGASANIESGV